MNKSVHDGILKGNSLFSLCQHSSLKYLVEENEFEDFIYDVDRDTGRFKT